MVITEADAEFDFETASEAGQIWDDERGTWIAPKGAAKRGLPAVNAAAYSEHPSTRVLTFSYRLPPWWGMAGMDGPCGGVKRRWMPGEPLPYDLFAYLDEGHPIEAFNVMFERLIWENVCVPKYGWPSMFQGDNPRQYQLRCAMAKARVNGYPGQLQALSEVLRLPTPKDKDGKRLLDKFSVPQKPTKKQPKTWILPADDPEDFERLRFYCDTDLDAEKGASKHPSMQPMSLQELEVWQIDQEINWRGLGVDRPAVRDCLAVLDQALARYGDECRQLTGGLDPTRLAQLQGWLAAQGVHMVAMDEPAITAKLAELPPHPPGNLWTPRRVLEIRQLIGSASVKKLYAMENQATRDDRLRNLLTHHGTRPGRPTGEGPQPLNLPKAGPELNWCRTCWAPFRATLPTCPWDGCGAPVTTKATKWPEPPKDAPEGTPWPIEAILNMMAFRNLDLIEYYFGDALLCISGCVRGLFVAKPGHELIASDYSSLQAVVLAMLAGEEWRIKAFQENQPIYLLSASKVTGTPLQVYLDYYEANGAHHPHRQKIGKVNELANGFGGWINSSRAFGSEEEDSVIRQQILAWRDGSPSIPEFWGGQFRGLPWDKQPVHLPEITCFGEVIRPAQWADPSVPNYYGVEGAAVQAILHPGEVFSYRGIRFEVRDFRPAITEPTWDGILLDYYDRVVVPADLGRLVVTLLPRFPGDPGRDMTYRHPQLTPAQGKWARKGEYRITYMTWNTNPKYGPMGWVPMDTYGGRLTENIVMGVEVDIQRHGMKLLRLAGYPLVLQVYDEDVAEIPIGTGSIEEFERLMATMPLFAQGWPIKAQGGWRSRRYRKAS